MKIENLVKNLVKKIWSKKSGPKNLVSTSKSTQNLLTYSKCSKSTLILRKGHHFLGGKDGNGAGGGKDFLSTYPEIRTGQASCPISSQIMGITSGKDGVSLSGPPGGQGGQYYSTAGQGHGMGLKGHHGSNGNAGQALGKDNNGHHTITTTQTSTQQSGGNSSYFPGGANNTGQHAAWDVVSGSHGGPPQQYHGAYSSSHNNGGYICTGGGGSGAGGGGWQQHRGDSFHQAGPSSGGPSSGFVGTTISGGRFPDGGHMNNPPGNNGGKNNPSGGNKGQSQQGQHDVTSLGGQQRPPNKDSSGGLCGLTDNSINCAISNYGGTTGTTVGSVTTSVKEHVN